MLSARRASPRVGALAAGNGAGAIGFSTCRGRLRFRLESLRECTESIRCVAHRCHVLLTDHGVELVEVDGEVSVLVQLIEDLRRRRAAEASSENRDKLAEVDLTVLILVEAAESLTDGVGVLQQVSTDGRREELAMVDLGVPIHVHLFKNPLGLILWYAQGLLKGLRKLRRRDRAAAIHVQGPELGFELGTDTTTGRAARVDENSSGCSADRILVGERPDPLQHCSRQGRRKLQPIRFAARRRRHEPGKLQGLLGRGSLCGVDAQELPDEVLGMLAHTGPHPSLPVHGRKVSALDGLRDVLVRAAAEWGLSAKQRIRDDADRPQVAGLIVLLPEDYLWRHVVESPRASADLRPLV
mmetsp:Transcript_122218/g.260789  ORF Transcript_122218/g.260789 Transcript_122218/m.260789 type:complete len:355 (-) Transcript_122218:676-1740(-)